MTPEEQQKIKINLQEIAAIFFITPRSHYLSLCYTIPGMGVYVMAIAFDFRYFLTKAQKAVKSRTSCLCPTRNLPRSHRHVFLL